MAQIFISWPPSPDPTAVGYLINAGRASRVYTAVGSPKDVGNVTFGTFDIGSSFGQWFFAVSAYDAAHVAGPPGPELVAWIFEGSVGALTLAGAAPVLSFGSVLRPRGMLKGT